jgi:transcriptional regulator with XRE-family HTH domain
VAPRGVAGAMVVDVLVAGRLLVVVVVGVAAHAVDDMVRSEERKPACRIRKTEVGMPELDDVEQVVRTRLRTLRNSLGLSLDELAERSSLSASTISRIETGKRTISLDVLLRLARALQVGVETLLDVTDDADVVIRPVANSRGDRTTWMLGRATSNTIAFKVRVEPGTMPETRVHPGHDWFFVLDGRIRLQLGEREVLVEAGEAAEFATMTPHAFAAVDGPAELIMIFDREGQRAHVHQ